MATTLTSALLVLALAPGPGASSSPQEEDPLRAETFAGFGLRNIGPALMSGRIADLAVHPDDRSTWYVAVGSGGVWKTVNAGTTWTPLFDDQVSYSIGCITLDPNDPDTVWVGTGENVGGRHVGYGDGLYRSRDGGQTWEHRGLGDSEHIGNVVVDPRDSDVVYVAVQGPLWSGGGDRGLYKTLDGGESWEKLLGGGPYTGVNEVHMDPNDPDTLYASTHQRLRNVAVLVNGGPETGIHKSVDGGATWRELSNCLPEQDMGRIGLAISPVDTDVVYATVELAEREGGFYRSVDGGETWEHRNDYLSGGTGPHYYQEIFASPFDVDLVYQMDVWIHVTRDGGATFEEIGETHKHSDSHALAFDPYDPDYLLIGCDGGIYETWDHGATWRFHANLPVTQFYKVAVDSDEPFYNVYGGTQDNSTQGGPARTDSENGIRNADWFITLFADGHQPAVDPENPDIVYSEWQEGNLVRYDRKTGEIVYIQPQPAEDEEWDRYNWDAPILISAFDPARLYYASQRVWRSDDRGDSWRPVSPDLTSGADRLQLPIMEQTWGDTGVFDLWAMSKYATITSLAESPHDEALLYAGTDDGRIQVSEDGGATWRLAGAMPDVPTGFFVNDLKADLFEVDTVYAVVDDHKSGDFRPLVYVSSDRGRSWTSMVGDLPDRHVCWRIVQDHVRPELFFLGTEFGLFFTVDAGAHWVELNGGVPTIPFRDLALQRREDDLVGATFGRGFFVLDDYAPLREVTSEVLAADLHLFETRDAWTYHPKRTLAGAGKAFQGDGYYVAPNPPFGAVFTVHLADALETASEARRRAEAEAREAGEGNRFPSWETLREESLEDDPRLVLTVRDASDAVVRILDAPREAGMHRVAWDLRYPPVLPGEPERWATDDGRGSLVPPGTYTVEASIRRKGATLSSTRPKSFVVKPLRTGTLPGASFEELSAFLRRIDDARGRMHRVGGRLARFGEDLDSVDEALLRSTVEDEKLITIWTALWSRSTNLERELFGDERRDNFGDPGPVSVNRRLDVVISGTRYSNYGPTPTLTESLAIAERGLTRAEAALDALDAEWRIYTEILDRAGVPWSSGR